MVGVFAAGELRVIDIAEAELRGRGCALDLGEAVVEEMRLRLEPRIGAEFGDSLGVLRLLRGFVNGGAPFLETLVFLHIALSVDGHVLVRPLLGVFAELLGLVGR